MTTGTINEIIQRNETKHTVNFLFYKDRMHTYKDINNRIYCLNRLLSDRGLHAGDTVLVALSDVFDSFSVFLALLGNGISTILIDPDTPKSKIQRILEISKINAWFVNSKSSMAWGLDQLDPEICGFPIDPPKKKKGSLVNKLLRKKSAADSTEHTIDTLIESITPNDELPKVQVNTVALILFTSGTTGEPKGIQLTHQQILSQLSTLSRQYQIQPESKILNTLHPFHVDGFVQGPLLSYYNGITCYRPLEFSITKIPELFDSIYKYAISHFFTVPSMIGLLNKFSGGFEDSFDTAEFRYTISSADVLQTEIWKEHMKLFKTKVLNVYGSSETVAGALFCGPDQDTWKIGSIGKPVDCEAKIISESSGSDASTNRGELLLKGDYIMNGYLNYNAGIDDDGWFHTGDIVEIDSEGYYHFCGRKKNVIIKGGINIQPEEIINALMSHNQVSDAFVFGIEDELWGQKIAAIVTFINSSPIAEIELKKYCASQLSEYAIPSEIHVVHSIPRSPAGKVQINMIKKMIREMQDQSFNTNSEIDEQKLNSELISIASETFQNTLTPGDLNKSSASIDGWNSVAHLDFATRLENQFGVRLTTRDIMNMTSLYSVEQILKAKLNL